MTQAFNLSQLGNNINSSGQVSLTAGVTGTLPNANLTSPIDISHGGTNNASLSVTAGGAVYTDGSKLASTAAGTSGYYLQSNGASAPTWTQVSTGSMTLLGTITTTAVNSVSLSSLTLTGYKSLYISMINIKDNQSTGNSGYCWISSTNINTGAGGGFILYDSSGANNGGVGNIDLSNGAIGGGIGCFGDIFGGSVFLGKTNVTTSTTTIYFRMGSAATFVASGSIVIYGVK